MGQFAFEHWLIMFVIVAGLGFIFLRHQSLWYQIIYLSTVGIYVGKALTAAWLTPWDYVRIIDHIIKGVIVGGTLMLIILLCRSSFGAIQNRKNKATIKVKTGLNYENQISDKEIISSKPYQNKENQPEKLIPLNPKNTLQENQDKNFELNRDFETAAKFFPELKTQLAELAVFGKDVQHMFVEQILHTKEYTKIRDVAEAVIDSFLIGVYGPNPRIKKHARMLIEKGKSAEAKKLQETVRVLGKAIETPEMIDRIINRQRIEEEHIRSLYISRLIDPTKHEFARYYMGLTINQRVIGKAKASGEPYKIYNSFKAYADATDMPVNLFNEISGSDKKREIEKFLLELEVQGLTEKDLFYT